MMDGANIPQHRAWIRTGCGVAFDLMEPTPAMIRLGDIAHALANLCRFTGHAARFYSVAEHAVHVSRLVPPPLALAALMHDAAEAYIGDVAAPLKAILPDYQRVEKRVESAVSARFGVTFNAPEIKRADADMLIIEQRQVLGDRGPEWGPIINPQTRLVDLAFWDPDEAQMEFIRRFEEVSL